ncbi:unnamed protein product [Periconia digitata]|uniref:Cytochrome P450 n=1 Tax=Periconia digitata TaxID=1303443 RepID=A0A9W4XV66_9PLEO|nr:unnamed protein product [Periconia digitata]
MGIVAAITDFPTVDRIFWTAFAICAAPVLYRIIYNQYFHPLSRFPGPWYAKSFSVYGALVSVYEREQEFLSSVVKKYGTDLPIRISPTSLFFPGPSALKDIYWNPSLNHKTKLYGTGALGPPHLFSTIDGEAHKQLRRALSNAPWTIGQLKNRWESRFDTLITLFIDKMNEHASANRTICISDKVAHFAADVMSMISFGEPFGCVANQRDEKQILENWRKGLPFFGFVARCRFFRDEVMRIGFLASWFLPTFDSKQGMGWLMAEADRQVTQREKRNAEEKFKGMPDFMQHCVEARYQDNTPLNPVQKRAHVTLLIQAGADTTATALGSILRFLVATPSSLARLSDDIAQADKAGLLSTPIKYEETRQHLPYMVAVIKEGLRLNPPAPNLFGRVVPAGGKVIDGIFIPGGTEVTTHAYTMQRDTGLYGEDAEVFKPERWLVNDETTLEYEASQFTFGMGPRVCLGKDIAIMEMYKLLPEIVRRFDIQLEAKGTFVVSGGVAYNKGFLGKFIARKSET